MTEQNVTHAENDAPDVLKSSAQLIIGAVLIALGFLWFTGALNPLSALLGGAALEESNAAYIKSVQAQSVKELVTMGAMLAVVDVISSVEVGFNFVATAEVSIGHALKTFALLLQRAADALMLSTAAFEVVAILLAIAKAISGPLFALSLICLGLLQVSRSFDALANVHRLIHEVTFIVISLFLFSYIILPYSIQISAWCSQEITHALHTATREGLAALETDIVRRSVDAPTPQEWTHKGTTIAAYDHLSHDLPQKVKSAAWLIWAFWARFLVHAILIPLLVVVVLRQFIHRVLRAAMPR